MVVFLFNYGKYLIENFLFKINFPAQYSNSRGLDCDQKTEHSVFQNYAQISSTIPIAYYPAISY